MSDSDLFRGLPDHGTGKRDEDRHGDGRGRAGQDCGQGRRDGLPEATRTRDERFGHRSLLGVSVDWMGSDVGGEAGLA